MSSVTTTGIYFGYAQVSPRNDAKLCKNDTQVWPMVMSLGWNPYYKNEKLTAVRVYASDTFCLMTAHERAPQEVHIMHNFESDFYGHFMKVLVLGYIRPELDYTSRGEHNDHRHDTSSIVTRLTAQRHSSKTLRRTSGSRFVHWNDRVIRSTSRMNFSTRL